MIQIHSKHVCAYTHMIWTIVQYERLHGCVLEWRCVTKLLPLWPSLAVIEVVAQEIYTKII